MNNDDERDYSEEAYNRHIDHTGDGTVSFCDVPTCPYYVDQKWWDERNVHPSDILEYMEYIGKHRR
jgi:hypothetical protein